MTVAIVIPATDYRPHCISLLDRLCKSIVRGGTSTSPETEIVICMDGCSTDFVEFFQDTYPDFTYLIHKGNRRNFCANSNMGLRYAHSKGMSAILCNQDTVLPDWKYLGWLQAAGQGLTSTQSVEESDQDKLNTLNQVQEPAYTSVLNDSVPANKFAGYCYYIDLAVMEEIGFLHEPFGASFDEDLYITKALLAGFPVQISNIKVYHEGTHIDQAALGGQSLTGAYGGDLLQMNHHKYRYMWQIPPEVQHPQYVKWILSRFTWSKEEMYDP